MQVSTPQARSRRATSGIVHGPHRDLPPARVPPAHVRLLEVTGLGVHGVPAQEREREVPLDEL